MAVGLISLYLLSLPVVGNRQLFLLQKNTQFVSPSKAFNDETTAIVVLGDFNSEIAPEYADEFAPGPYLLSRLRYANLLAKELKLPILVSGGLSDISTTPEAVLMNQILVEEYDSAVRYLEPSSHHLKQQAQNIAKIFSQHKLTTMVLISQAWSMKRASKLMANEGLKVYPAAVGFVQRYPNYSHKFTPYLPSMKGLSMSVTALQERIGLWVYNF